MKQLILKYKKYILIFFGIATVILLLLAKKSPSLPQLASFSPQDQSQNNALTVVPTYIFEIPISISDITIRSNPPFEYSLSQTDEGTIVANHRLAFQPSSTYTITLIWQDQIILTHTFTTKKSQEDPLLIQSMKDELARDYPLAQLLPLETSQYRIVYSAPMTLEITVKNPNLTSTEAIDYAKNWVSKNGSSSNLHKFVVTSTTPSPAQSSTPLSTAPLE